MGQYSEEARSRTHKNLVYKHMRVLEEVAEQVMIGTRRSAVVCGPTGIGKNYVFEAAFRRHGLRWNPERPMSEVALIEAIEERSGKEDINVFDESDHMLRHLRMLNVLKIATDSKASEVILSYRVRNPKLRIDPFPVKSGFIFLMNTNLHDRNLLEDKRLDEHIKAFNSRCSPFVMTFSHNDIYEYTAYLVASERMLMKDGFSRDVTEQALAYFAETMHRVRDVSPRRIRNIATEIRRSPESWRDYLEPTLEKPWCDPPNWVPRLEPPGKSKRVNRQGPLPVVLL
ncbi:hypothetical protein [Methylorubrum extorquens]